MHRNTMFLKRDLGELVAEGKKTQTTRLKDQYRVGSVLPIFCGPQRKGLRVRILGMARRRLGDFTEEDALREGFPDLRGFMDKWVSLGYPWEPEKEVYVFRFELVKSDEVKPTTEVKPKPRKRGGEQTSLLEVKERPEK